MLPAIILYGSRARGDFRYNSDVDLLLASTGVEPETPTLAAGVSLHRYPRSWLQKEANSGSLFVYHVANEGVGLEDRGGLLIALREGFRRKPSYASEIRTATLIIKMLIESDWGANSAAQRRYFWALRTTLVGASAEVGIPKYAAEQLELLSAINGVADLINHRDQSTFIDCHNIGKKVLEKYLISSDRDLHGENLRDFLMNEGGVSMDTVRIIEESEAISIGGLSVYN